MIKYESAGSLIRIGKRNRETVVDVEIEDEDESVKDKKQKCDIRILTVNP